MNKIKNVFFKVILFVYLFVRIQYLLVKNVLTKPKKRSPKLYDDYASIVKDIKRTHGLTDTYEDSENKWKNQYEENPPKIRHQQLSDILTLPDTEPNPYGEKELARLKKMQEFVETNRKKENKPDCMKMENIKKNQPELKSGQREHKDTK